MEDNRSKLSELLHKEDLSSDEKLWLYNYIENSQDGELKDIMELDFKDQLNGSNSINPVITEKIWANIRSRTIAQRPPKVKIIQLWSKKLAVAASIIGLITIGVYFLTNRKNRQQNYAGAHRFKNDVPAGKEKAVLTLADGSKIDLDDQSNGAIAKQGNTSIQKTNGELAYSVAGANAGNVSFNTLSTPRGGNYQVELPDGSRVWLNAASSLRFPTVFSGNTRVVELTGEGYFEVAKNKAMPFIVKVNNAEIRVLGTHFNVMAYQDESALKTTLLEGSVQFKSGASINILKPGEQSQLNKDGNVKILPDVDVDDVVAWKNGSLHFENEDIESVMRRISRWYNIDVVYNKKSNDRFYAEMPSESNLSEVLKALELTGKISFDIQGQKVIVNP